MKRLTVKEKKEVVELWLANARQVDLADRFGVSQATISAACTTARGQVGARSTGARTHVLRAVRPPVEPVSFTPPKNPPPRALTGREGKWVISMTRMCGAHWDWAGPRDTHGYGVLVGSTYKAHRAVWQLFFGLIPEGLSVLHRCDRRQCVNPDHLFLGTQQDNMRDMVAKGRGVTPPPRLGVKNNKAKLTWVEVQRMRRLREKDGWKIEALAAEFEVSKAQVSNITNYRQRRDA